MNLVLRCTDCRREFPLDAAQMHQHAATVHRRHVTRAELMPTPPAGGLRRPRDLRILAHRRAQDARRAARAAMS